MFFKKITLNNFMGVATRTVEFSRNTSIFGRNGSGKTSVKEAIIYVLTGSIYGTPQIDEAIHNGANYLSVVLELEHDGKTFILERRRPLDTKGGYSIIKMNGAEVKQEVITEQFGTWEEIISGICVGEFMSMDEIDEKFDIINNLIQGDPKKIYDEMVGPIIAEKYPYGTITSKEIDARVKIVNKEIESVGVKRQQISSRISEIGTPSKPTSIMDMSAIDLIRIQIADLDLRKPVLKTPAQNNQIIQDIDMEIRTQEFELTKLKKPDNSELQNLRTRYTMLQEQRKGIADAAMCQCCLRPFDQVDIDQQLQKKDIDMKAILDLATPMKADYDNLLLAYNTGAQMINTLVDSLKQKRIKAQQEIAMANMGSIEDYNSEIKAWEATKSDLVQRLGRDEATLREQTVAMQSYNSAADRIESLKKEDQDLVASLMSHDLASLEKVQFALSPKGVTFKEIEIKIAEVMKYFPKGFNIELLKKNKSNDEYKKVFNVSLDGVAYKWLSKGMKKIVDTHFCNLISEKKNYNVLLIDDIESLTSAIMPTDKIKQIVTFCAKNTDFEVKNV